MSAQTTLAAPTGLQPFLQQASALPAMPEVAQKLLRSFDRDDLSLDSLASLVARDQALAAKVMRLANSPRYAPSRAVTGLGEASAMLGMRAMRDLTLAACLAGSFPAIRGFDRQAFWRGTLAVAAYAQPLARALGEDDDTAYIGGLMLRIGQVLVLMVAPEAALQIQRETPGLDGRIETEQRVLGCSHPQLTAALARHWKFPPHLATAFEAAVDPLAVRPFCRLGAVLRLASIVADARDSGLAVDLALNQVAAPLVQHLQLDLGWLHAHLPDHALATAGADTFVH